MAGPPTQQQIQWLTARLNRDTEEYKARQRMVIYPPGPDFQRLPRSLPDDRRIATLPQRTRAFVYHKLVPDAFDVPDCDESMASEHLVKLRYLYTKAALLRDMERRSFMTHRAGAASEYNDHKQALVETLRRAKHCHGVISERRARRAAEIDSIFGLLQAQAEHPFQQAAPTRVQGMAMSLDDGW